MGFGIQGFRFGDQGLGEVYLELPRHIQNSPAGCEKNAGRWFLRTYNKYQGKGTCVQKGTHHSLNNKLHGYTEVFILWLCRLGLQGLGLRIVLLEMFYALCIQPFDTWIPRVTQFVREQTRNPKP